MLVIFAIFYLLILRPQSKRQKAHEQMLSELVKGDRIVTTGGVHGVVQRVNEKEGTLILKISDETKVELDRSAVARKISGSSGE
jgi:preprotein translocase subunit YajC